MVSNGQDAPSADKSVFVVKFGDLIEGDHRVLERPLRRIIHGVATPVVDNGGIVEAHGTSNRVDARGCLSLNRCYPFRRRQLFKKGIRDLIVVAVRYTGLCHNICSPACALSTNWERCVLASLIFIVFTSGGARNPRDVWTSNA